MTVIFGVVVVVSTAGANADNIITERRNRGISSGFMESLQP